MTEMFTNLTKRLSILIALTCLLGNSITGCALTPKAAKTPEGPLPEPLIQVSTLSAPDVPLPAETAEPSTQPVRFEIPADVPEYNLDIVLNYYSKYADITQTITYTNNTGQPLDDILLRVPPRYFPGTYLQKSLEVSPTAQIEESGLNTSLKLNHPLASGAQARVRIMYRLVMPQFTRDDGAWTFGASDQQTNLTNFYPFIPPYKPGTGWIFHEPVYDHVSLPVGENIVNESANFDVHLRLTDHPELIEVAASSPMLGEEKSGDYRYHMELTRGFSFSISDSYFINEVTEGGVTVRSYSFINNQKTGKDVLELGVNAIKLYGELFYPYPRPLISIVVADYLHNMEMDGMVMISYGVFDFYNGPKTNLAMLAPHEILHQWFYSQVGNDQAREPWLDEALCTYGELLYYERYYPDLVDWWWRNRIHGWSPEGYVNSDIETPGGYEPYRLAVYLRGAIFMQELRNTIGDEAFFAFLKDYAITNTYKISTRDDFFTAISRHSSADIKSITDRFFKQ